jgi:hypothetical protein
MADLLSKISSYNIFNYLFPGVLFAIGADGWLGLPIIQKDLLITGFVCYFAGMVVSRVGSLIVEPLAKWTGLVVYAKYTDFVKASAKDPKLEILSEVNNTYRTLCGLFLTLLVLKAYLKLELICPFLAPARLYLLVAVLIVMFATSFRKQSAYITKRVGAWI